MNSNTIIYCISLVNSNKRREHILKVVDDFNIAFEFVNAVDGTCLSEKEKKSYASRDRRNFYPDLTNKEIACSLSHQKALRSFLKTKYQYLILIEDDAEFNVEIEPVLKVLQAIPNWDIVKLENRNGEKPKFIIKQTDISTIYVPYKATHGATGILYSRAGAKKVLLMNREIEFAFDTKFIMSDRYHLRYLATYPPLVKEVGAPSTIGNRGQIKPELPIEKIQRKLFRINTSIRKRIWRIRIFLYFKTTSHFSRSG